MSDVRGNVRRAWEREAAPANDLAIFAGHFHESNRSLYGTRAGVSKLAIAKSVAGKTVVAPCHQEPVGQACPARGFLIASATRKGIVGTQVLWFNDAR